MSLRRNADETAGTIPSQEQHATTIHRPPVEAEGPERIPINLMHSRSLSALMVRSRNVESTRIPQPRARRLEHASRACPTCAHELPISGKPEIGGPPHPSRRSHAVACVLLRMRRINGHHLSVDSFPAMLGISDEVQAYSRIRRPSDMSLSEPGANNVGFLEEQHSPETRPISRTHQA